MARNTVQNYVNNLPKEPDSSLAIKLIVLPESQPRRYFDPEKIQQLADSIREYGILEPLLVRPIPTKPNFYEFKLKVSILKFKLANSLLGINLALLFST